MKVLKTISISALALFPISEVKATTLVAGWDFSQYLGAGLNSVDGATFVGSINNNYSDFNSPSPSVSPSYGALYYDGTNGSSNSGFGTGSDTVIPFTGNLSSNSIQTADGNPFNDTGSYNFLKNSGQAFQSDLSLGVSSSERIVFSASLDGSVGSNWSLQFAGQTELAGQSGSVDWSYSTNGTDFLTLGQSSVFSDVDTGFVVDFGGALDGASTVFLQGNINPAASGKLVFDNVGIHTEVGAIPEPSTYALIIIGIGMIGFFRMRLKK